MPDDRQPGGPPGGQPGGEPDETRQFRPDFADDATVVGRPPADDDTVVGRPPADDDTVVGRPPADDPTAVRRPAMDDTMVGPPLDPTEPDAAGGVWSGRAEVPPAGVRGPGPQTQRWEQVQPVDEPGRWWMPILVGLAGLLLLGLLGYGLWLIAAGQDEPGPATPTATRVVPTVRPTTAAPPTQEPEPTEEEVEQVEVPPLAGEELPDAQSRLDELGLTYRVRFEETDEQEAGRVVRTEPGEGSRLEPGTRITIVVAAAPEPTQPPTDEPSATQTPDQD